MPLDYKRSYKTKLIRRKVITFSIIAVIFLLASFFILYLKFWDDDIAWNPFRENDTNVADGQTGQEAFDAELTEEGTENVTGTEDSGNGDAASEDTGEGSEAADNTAEDTKDTKTGSDRKDKSEKYGLALKRQPVYLYTIGIARISLSDVNREYTLEDKRVDDSYFDDALFIGDSRTEGFMMYSSLKNIHAYCSKGLSITRIYEEKVVTLEDGRTVTVMEALQTETYGKIYIMFGVNELGWPYEDTFEEQYSKMIRDIKQLQPDALIYVQNILPISAERSREDAIYNNDNVYRFNTIIKRVCETQNVIYLDVASSVADENGALPADASTDGIHCNGTYCDIWLEYLRNNTYTVKATRIGKPVDSDSGEASGGTGGGTENTEDNSETTEEPVENTEENPGNSEAHRIL